MKKTYIGYSRMAMWAAPLALAILSGCGHEAPVNADESEVRTSDATAKLAALKASVKGTDIAPVTDYGRSIGLSDHAKGTSVAKVLSEITGTDESDITNDGFSSTSGAKAVEAFASALDDAAHELLENGEKDDAKAAAALKKVAADARAYFVPTQFESIVTKEHSIQEDGDLESHTLIATKRDGSLVVLSYTNFPF